MEFLSQIDSILGEETKIVKRKKAPKANLPEADSYFIISCSSIKGPGNIYYTGRKSRYWTSDVRMAHKFNTLEQAKRTMYPLRHNRPRIYSKKPDSPLTLVYQK